MHTQRIIPKLLKTFLVFILLLHADQMFSQIFDPVSWETRVEKINEFEYDLISLASIEPGWRLYSIDLPEGGPEATTFTFPQSESYILEGDVKQEEPITIFDDIFGMETSFFEYKAEFRQRIVIRQQDFTKVEAEVYFMVCNDLQCLPPETKMLVFKMPFEAQPSAQKQETSVANSDEESSSESNETDDDRSFWGIFIVSFLSGFAALLTPCVFPMIPLTVSFFTKQSKTRALGIRNAIIYGLSIIIIYVILGSLVTLIFGADALNALSTNVWFNLIFFLLLVIFAVSFLGAFEIVLPSSWGTKMDAQADRGGLVGIFFMALALAIVSFSCTGPIVGTLLVEAASQGGLAPVVGMLGFSSAIAIPFALFAAFPGWMNSLPRSGGWLNTVKAVLGFLELALAFKFLSNADLVLQLHILERETFLAIWIAIFVGLSLYLFGKITLSHDSKLTHISVGRLSLGLFVLAFTVYLIPGLWGAPLQWISGFPPPQQYSESPYGVGSSRGGSSSNTTLPEEAELGPHDIPAFKDYDAGMAYAKKINKPVLLDFTGYACVNCRKMEERVWSDPKVLQVLKNDVVLISLYVDDKRNLPEAEQYVSETTGKKIKTIGNKWSDFQIKTYQANAQPYYVIIDNAGKSLNQPTGYDPDIEEYLNWLQLGIDAYNKG